jgi:glycerol kinase
MEEDSHIELKALKVDGGACANNFLMQFQSDILNVQVDRPKVIETTALGAAYLAGIAVGYWQNREDVRKNWAISKNFMPVMKEDKREKLARCCKEIHGMGKTIKIMKKSCTRCELQDFSCNLWICRKQL